MVSVRGDQPDQVQAWLEFLCCIFGQVMTLHSHHTYCTFLCQSNLTTKMLKLGVLACDGLASYLGE